MATDAHLVTDGAQTGWLKVHIVFPDNGAAVTLGSIANPEGCLLHIYRGFLHVHTDADAAATLDIGIGAADADSDDICSAFDVNAPAHDTVWNLIGTDLASEAAATTPKGIVWPATSYLNFYSKAAANGLGCECWAYFKYIRLD